MNRAAWLVDVGAAYPRTQWYRSDALAVIGFAFLLAAALGATWCDARAKVGALYETDRRLAREIAVLSPQTAPIRAQLTQIQQLEGRRDRIFNQRRSGLNAASSVDTAGRALRSDAVATTIDSRGQLEGYATSYDALARVWQRLGSGYIVTSAEPAGSSVRFQIAPLGSAQRQGQRR